MNLLGLHPRATDRFDFRVHTLAFFDFAESFVQGLYDVTQQVSLDHWRGISGKPLKSLPRLLCVPFPLDLQLNLLFILVISMTCNGLHFVIAVRFSFARHLA